VLDFGLVTELLRQKRRTCPVRMTTTARWD
jgi:hypothetical protein